MAFLVLYLATLSFQVRRENGGPTRNRVINTKKKKGEKEKEKERKREREKFTWPTTSSLLLVYAIRYRAASEPSPLSQVTSLHLFVSCDVTIVTMTKWPSSVVGQPKDYCCPRNQHGRNNKKVSADIILLSCCCCCCCIFSRWRVENNIFSGVTLEGEAKRGGRGEEEEEEERLGMCLKITYVMKYG